MYIFEILKILEFKLQTYFITLKQIISYAVLTSGI